MQQPQGGMGEIWQIVGILLTGIVAAATAMSALYEWKRRRIEAPRVTITDDGIYRRGGSPIHVSAKVAEPFEAHWTIDSARISKPPASALLAEMVHYRDEWNNPEFRPSGWKRVVTIGQAQVDLFLHPDSPTEFEITWSLRSLSSKRETSRFTIDIKIKD